MKLDLETVQRKLAEWKEKILFVVIVLLTLNVALNASPLGGGVERIEAEERHKAILAAQIEESTAIKARDALDIPPDVSPTPIEPLDVLALFYDERDVYVPPRGKTSGWMPGRESFERLPPLPLVLPGIPPLTDFDLPAGPMPALDRARGMVPRDTRKVTLAAVDTTEFKE